MSPGEFADKLACRAEAAGFILASELVETLRSYYQLLLTWNRKINLTAMNLEELPPDAVDRLFVEPAAAARGVTPGSRIIDIGSGGGSPAIPFALAAKGAFLTMVESRIRKSVFLQEAARVVALPAQVVTARYEDAVERAELQGAFEIVTIRAVRVSENSLRQLARLVAPGGSILLFQASEVASISPSLTAQTRQLTERATLQVLALDNKVPRGTKASRVGSHVSRGT